MGSYVLRHTTSTLFQYVYYLGEVQFVKIEQPKHCPSETEITTKSQCKDAMKWAKELGITLQAGTKFFNGSWDHIPYQCSYKYTGDNAFHFNHQIWNEKFANHVFTNYRMICKKGKMGLQFVL